MRPPWAVSAAVQAALAGGRAVVALESTIITHGLPRPVNYETALQAEAAVRKAGAEPATIAVLDGVAQIGLSSAQLARIAESPAETTVKTSRANLAQVLAKGHGYVGGTTVSGTMALAHLAGIRVFATGGIGGVHRGGETSMDVSADLTELGRTPVAVFSSGAKSILDIPRTLEYLETQGVPVMTFDAAGRFPCFYTAASPYYVPKVSSVQEAARVIAANEAMRLTNGLLFGVPIPRAYEDEGVKIQQAVEVAVQESVEQGIDRQGKLATPWLLRRVGQLAKQSIASNVALVLNNAHTAAACAVELSKLTRPSEAKTYPSAQPNAGPTLLVIGCAAVDLTAQRSSASATHTTTPGHVSLSLGGVAYNIALAAHRTLGDGVVLAAPTPRGALETYWHAAIAQTGLQHDTSVSTQTTPMCTLVLDEHGELETGVADMAMVESALTPDVVEGVFQKYAGAGLAAVAVDANGSHAALRRLASLCVRAGIPMVFEPTSTAKAVRLVEALHSTGDTVAIATPNALEVEAMATRLGPWTGEKLDVPRSLEAFPDARRLVNAAARVSDLVHLQLVTLGAGGLLIVQKKHDDTLFLHHVPALPLDRTRAQNSTGAGDAFTGAVLVALTRTSTAPEEWTSDALVALAQEGQHAAVEGLYRQAPPLA